MIELPIGWVNTVLKEACHVIRGITFPASAKQEQLTKDNVCCLRTTNIQREIDWNKIYFISQEYIKRPEQRVQVGDILMSMANSYELVGKVAIARDVPYPTAFGAFLAAVRPTSKIDGKFLFHFLRTNHVQELLRVGSSQTVNIANISAKTLSEIPIPLPPLNEQKRIADKLDILLAAVDTCRARLDKVPALIKRFRQSVLAAATSGALTEDWRVRAGLMDLNETKILSEVADVIDPHPSHRTPPVVLDGVPYIGIGEVDKKGTLNLSSAKTVSWNVFDEHKKRYEIRDGDFIFGKIGTLGRPTRLPIGEKYVISANVILIQPKVEKVYPEYLLLLFSSPKVLSDIAGQANSTSQAAFGIKKMRAFSLYLPSKQEQQEIVRRVEALFVIADKLEERLATARKRVDQLTPAILAKAFRGELVEQDPRDEPASVLLEKIANPVAVKRSLKKAA